jgi:carboxymethylenebutenolidase
MEIKSPVGTFEADYFKPTSGGAHIGIIIIHEIWGLNDQIRGVAQRFAAAGYATLAVDILSNTGVLEKIEPHWHADLWNAEKRAEIQPKMREATAPIYSPDYGKRAVEELKSAFQFLKNEGCGKVGVLGFCFGGTYSYALAVHEPELAFAIPFYGRGPELQDVSTIKCPILAFYGGKDEALMQALPALKEKMQQEGKVFDAHVYPNAGHAFFNEQNPATYVQDDAEDAWKKIIAFLNQL